VSIRPLSTIATAALLLATLGACTAATPPRTAPDQIEQAAVSEALVRAQIDGSPVEKDLWVQLWTPTQAGSRIASCVRKGSDGHVTFEPKPIALSTSGISYSVGFAADGTSSSIDGGVGPPFLDSGTVQRLVDGCLATYPVDSRLFAVPARDRAALYSYDLTVLRRCLLAHGQEVPRLPTRERFDNLMRASAPWNAYDLVVVASRTEWYALADACPALPPTIAGDVAAITTSATTP
jgi:hypothetical protein